MLKLVELRRKNVLNRNSLLFIQDALDSARNLIVHIPVEDEEADAVMDLLDAAILEAKGVEDYLIEKEMLTR